MRYCYGMLEDDFDFDFKDSLNSLIEERIDFLPAHAGITRTEEGVFHDNTLYGGNNIQQHRDFINNTGSSSYEYRGIGSQGFTNDGAKQGNKIDTVDCPLFQRANNCNKITEAYYEDGHKETYMPYDESVSEEKGVRHRRTQTEHGIRLFFKKQKKKDEYAPHQSLLARIMKHELKRSWAEIGNVLNVGHGAIKIHNENSMKHRRYPDISGLSSVEKVIIAERLEETIRRSLPLLPDLPDNKWAQALIHDIKTVYDVITIKNQIIRDYEGEISL